MATLQQWAYEIRNKYTNRVASILGMHAPGQISIVIKPTLPPDAQGNVPAATTSGTVITLNASYFHDHMDDKGAVVHEIAHAVLGQYGNFSGPTWLSEGLADYVRDKAGLGSSSDAGDQVHQGYQEGAAFLQWLDKVSPGSAVGLAKAATDGSSVDWSNINGYVKAYKSGDTAEQVRHIINGNGDGNAPSGGQQNGLPPTFHLLPGIGGGGGVPDPNDNTGTGGDGGDTSGRPPKPTAPPGYDEVWKNGQWTLVKSGGGDGNGGAAKRREEARDNLAASYHGILTSLGIPLDDELQAMVQNGIHNGWSTTRFTQHLYQTDAFHEAFPGIFNADGTMKMSPQQYLQNVDAYQSIGSTAGIDVGDKKLAWLFNHNVSPQEFQDRGTAFKRLQDNPHLLTALNQQRAIDGQAPLTQGDLFKGIMGEGNRDFYESWQAATTRYEAQQAGLHIARVGKDHLQAYAAITQGMLNRLNNKGLTEDQYAQGFQQLGDTLLKDLPSAAIEHTGLSRKEISAAVFGGQGSAEARKKISSIEARQQAQDQNEIAAGPAYAGQGGKLAAQSGYGTKGSTE